jgi:primosomal protein DnaI
MDPIKDSLKAYAPKTSNNEALRAILADPAFLKELHALGLGEEAIEENLPLVSSYQDDRSYCAHCPGLEACQKDPNPQATMKLVWLNGLLQREYSPCELYMAKQRLLQGYLYRDFPEEWLSSMPNALGRSTRTRDALGAMNLASKSPAQPWAYFTGVMGSGRSFLLATYANLFVSQGLSVAFINANKRFDELKGMAISARGLFEKKMAELETCYLLIIDDFGSEFKSDYVRDQIVLPLLNERAKNNRLTFFASDYTPDEIQTLYSSDKTAAIYAKSLVNLIRSHIAKVCVVEKGFETYFGKK